MNKRRNVDRLNHYGLKTSSPEAASEVDEIITVLNRNTNETFKVVAGRAEVRGRGRRRGCVRSRIGGRALEIARTWREGVTLHGHKPFMERSKMAVLFSNPRMRNW